MLKTIKNFFNDEENLEKLFSVDKNLAAAVLMVEAAAMDGVIDDTELATIKGILTNGFGMEKAEANELIIEATKHQKDSNHILRFTKAIKDHFSEDERIEVMEMLWEVVYSDGFAHDYETNLLRRIGGLIYVSDRDRGNAKKRVLAKLGIE